jgi:hypothetical protein
MAEKPALRAKFDEVLTEILGYKLEWAIDMNDAGQFFLRQGLGAVGHNSEGLGDGIVNVLFIADAFYDARPESIIVIDEPELSMHPSLQQRVFKFLRQQSAHHQIVIATHSPYFVAWDALFNGAKLYRTSKPRDTIELYEISTETVKGFQRFLQNVNFPHALGLDQRGVFFLEDGIILFEGQEDVVVFQSIAQQLHLELPGAVYGWGVGGHTNFPVVCHLLKELGFKRIAAVLDAGTEETRKILAQKFPEIAVFTLPTPDVRDKPAQIARTEKAGLANSHGIVHPIYKEYSIKLISNLTVALAPSKERQAAS